MGIRKNLTNKLWNSLPDMPTLGTTVDIPVYVIHNGPYKEDYFFIFDFEEFVEKSRSGRFVRPRLQVWSGRDDFDRGVFARQFRESFSEEFDVARQALRKKDETKDWGWLTWDLRIDALDFAVAAFIAQIFLLMALSAGRLAWSAIPWPKWATGKSDEEKLEASIQETQTKVDAALKRMKIRVHPELVRYAYREEIAPKALKVEGDAWPLPSDIVDHLGDGRTQSRW
ncbi:MAG: hypothetical protein AAFQ64_09240 [Pseudomonadota bacterium]